MSEDFKIWWHREGSGMPPLKGEDTCEHVERVSAIAWSNGAYKATEALKEENARLKAEVERLTKAGDAFVLLLEDEGYDMESIREVDGWLAAKEGKPRA
jgi:hypothetical protein